MILLEQIKSLTGCHLHQEMTRGNKSIFSLLLILLKHVSGLPAEYIDKTRLLPTEDNYNDKCPECSTVITLSNFPILSNESLTFNYTDKRAE